LNETVSDTEWTLYSGTGEATEHGTAWTEIAEAGRVNGDVLASGGIGHESRSVLLAYLKGSGAPLEPHYLK